MDWQLTCRVCLETGENMVSLFDWDENNEQLCDKYSYCCGVEVPKDDNLPTLICLNCVDRLTFSYQFKQQCLSSNETLKDCLEEFTKSTTVTTGSAGSNGDTEIITIKQEDGVLLQYELPVEHDASWTRTLTTAADKAVITKAPEPRKRGRPRKYLNAKGQIDVSPYQRKTPVVPKKETQSLTSLLNMDIKKETENAVTEDEQEPFQDNNDDDPDFDADLNEASDDDTKMIELTPRKRGRKKKQMSLTKMSTEDGEDMLLKETILAFSEPIPEHILNPKPKQRKKYEKKKYTYDKNHTCETCGSSFTSNASLQAHIRRHLGIKPFVCSICGYSCVLKEALKRHMLRHTGERPYKCRICERRFGDFGTRQKHERLHMGVRPYQCSVCGKSFTYSYVLANHMLTHTGEKKYQCGPCNKKFTKAHHLKYHNKVHHKELYLQQQLEAEAKKLRQQIVTGLTGGVVGQLADGRLQLVQMAEDGTEEEASELHIIKEDSDDKETHRAVKDMQVVLESDFCIDDKEQSN